MAGSRSIKAVYAGSGTIIGSTSSAITVTVAKATPVITITSISPSPTTAFNTTTVTGTIASTASIPTGWFGKLLLNGIPIDVTSGFATTFNRSSVRIPPGTWAVTASYPGSANFNPAVSAPVSHTVTGSRCYLDINNTTQLEGPDGQAILAWLLGFRGQNLKDAAHTPGFDPALESTGEAIDLMLAPQYAAGIFDLDGDGQSLPTTDGLMLLRVMLGLTGTAVTQNAINPAGTRPDWTSVRNYLNTTCGMSLQ